MPIDTFSPPVPPSVESDISVAPRVNEVIFGDGYSQRSGDGLNADARTCQMRWVALTVAEAETMAAFFSAHTSAAFLWSAPLESVQRKWRVVGWSRGYAGRDLVNLTVNLKQVFDL